MARIHGSLRRFSSQVVVPPPVVIDSPPTGRRARIDRERSANRQRHRERLFELCYYVDNHGRQHFNFPQRVWLDPSVTMAYTTVPSTALQTLAVNLLMLVVRERDYEAAVGITSRRAMHLAEEFVRECLLDAPEQAWVLPRSTIKAWVDTRLRISAAGRGRPLLRQPAR